MVSVIFRVFALSLCCIALDGCVLAVVGAAAAGGTLAVNSDKLGANDEGGKPAAKASYAPPAPTYQPPQTREGDEQPSQLTPPAERSSSIKAQPLDAPTPLH